MSAKLNNTYPVLPLRDTALFPDNVLPLAVGRSKTVKLINDAITKTGEDGMIVLLSQKDKEVEDPGVNDIYTVGTLAKVLKVIEVKKGVTFNVIVQGVRRVKLTQMTEVDPYFVGEFEDFEITEDGDMEEKALFQSLHQSAMSIVKDTPDAPQETPELLDEITDADKFCDFIAANLEATVSERQSILEASTLKEKMKLVLGALNRQIQISKTADQIQENMMEETDKVQREYYLRQQLKAIKRELGEGEDGIDDLEYRLENTEMPEEAEETLRKQIDRLRTMQSSSSEYSVTLNYVETLLDIPWEISTDDVMDLDLAQSVLDNDHYGLEKVKDRIVEYLAVRTLKDDMKGPILCLAGPPGVGKAQPLYSKIMTPEGWTTMGEIKVGTKVIGSDGKPHKVSGVFPQGEKDIFRVHFNDGTFTDCCKEHLWKTQTDNDRKANREGTVKSLETIMETVRAQSDQRRNHSIPMTDPVQFEEKEFPLDPYVLGALLGDGTLLKNGSAKFSSPQKDVLERISSNLPSEIKLLKETGNNVDYRLTVGRRPDTDENGYVTKNELQNILIELGIAGCKSDEKFVPTQFLYGSVSQRIDLLKGLMDTDGTVDKSGSRVEFSSTSKRLAENVQFLVQSLGGVTRPLRTKDGWYKDSEGNRVDCKVCYRLTLSMPPQISPFYGNKKSSRHAPKTKYAPKRFIDRIEPLGKEEAQCIMIDSEDHLYLTDEFIVTHNTSLGRSIARALGRKFIRISLGGISDESEIRGHRRTYVGAMPGRLVKSLNKAGVNNPVILLDEIDKMSKDFKGDPQSAMLEVLDPEQNHTFADHYVEVPVDLSKVLFIATANQLGAISAPLRDRMEIIEVPSYTSFEKKQIAKAHLVPKQIKNHGITDDHISFDDEGIDYLIDKYTREAGVRSLERRIADVCRSVAVKVAKTDINLRDDISMKIGKTEVTDALGPERHHSEIAQRTSVAGVSTGLAWTQAGGDILFVEATKMKGKGKVKFTGQLGDVMKESVEAAISYLRSNSQEFGLPADFMEELDLHVHFPAGGVPKDGPSAGITIFTALVSILTGIKVKPTVAMTGEITLRGSVLPVGGIKEKVTAAHRAGIKTIIMPEKCRKDLIDVNDEIQTDIEFHFVSRVDEVPPIALTDALPQVPVVTADPDGVVASSPEPDVVN